MKFNNAAWISAPEGAQTCPLFKKQICLRGTVKKAELRATAMGMYRFFIDGKDVTDALFMPGWTDYVKRVQVQTYDVTRFFACCKEYAELSLLLGNGWASAEIFVGVVHPYIPRAAAIAELTLTYADGKKERFGTDKSWETWTNRCVYSELYMGETQDATLEPQRIGYAQETHVKAKLVPDEGEPVVEGEIVYPRALITTPNGERVIDFGQNLAGYVRVKCRGPRGGKISFVPAEILDKDGNFYNGNYRNAANRCTYTLSGGEDEFKPVFSFQGFRYIRIDEYFSEDIDLSCFNAIAVHSDIKRTGRFVCGNEKINQLYSNIIWGQRSNYIDVPTDCPQRDERLGWTGDAQVFCRTAAINFDVHKFFRKWLHDLILDQHKNGGVESVIPIVKGIPFYPASGWSDAVTICPWEIYLAYGDKQLLSECYPAMCKWIEYIKNEENGSYIWNAGFHFGDWLATDAPYGSFSGATDTSLIDTAFYAYSLSIVINAGNVLGKDTSGYRALREKVVEAFRRKFIENGLPKGKPAVCCSSEQSTCYTQTALSLILYFGLGEEKDRKRQTDALVELIEQNGMRMTTGFLGTPYILHSLSENGRDDIAYSLLLQEKAPSWLFSVNMGATTMWEHWDGINEKGEVWNKDMNSFNHYAYGAVFDWIFGKAVGIQPLLPAYERVRICPHPDARLHFTDMAFDTRYGTLRAKWTFLPDGIRYEYEIPEGACAEIILPDGKKYEVSKGNYVFFTK